jgi:hypothetical protein
MEKDNNYTCPTCPACVSFAIKSAADEIDRSMLSTAHGLKVFRTKLVIKDCSSKN